MSDPIAEFVWVFNGEGGQFPSAVFSNMQKAESWIAKTGCAGVLTRYPLDDGAYDWCIAKGYFKPESHDQTTGVFIQRFSHAAQEHYHYENVADVASNGP